MTTRAFDDPPAPPPATAVETRAYIGDMLAQLADMAAQMNDRRLEYGLRLLALDAAPLR